MTAIQLLSTSPILESNDLSQRFMNGLVDALAWLLPDLDGFTRSDWLIYGRPDDALSFVLIQTLITLTILIAAGLFDLYRKEL